MISRKSWDYIKTFSKRLCAWLKIKLFSFAAAREQRGSTVLTRGICCSPTSLKKDRRKICLSFFLRRKRWKKYTHEIRKKEHSLWYVSVFVMKRYTPTKEKQTE